MNDTFMYSEKLQSMLYKSGWHPGRKFNTQEWVQKLSAHNVNINQQALLILEAFGDLIIVPERTLSDAYYPEKIVFDPVTDVLSEVDRIFFWQERLNTVMTPIGVHFPSESILVVCADSHVYAEYGNILSDCGPNFEWALENTLVFARVKPTHIFA